MRLFQTLKNANSFRKKVVSIANFIKKPKRFFSLLVKPTHRYIVKLTQDEATSWKQELQTFNVSIIYEPVQLYVTNVVSRQLSIYWVRGQNIEQQRIETMGANKQNFKHFYWDIHGHTSKRLFWCQLPMPPQTMTQYAVNNKLFRNSHEFPALLDSCKLGVRCIHRTSRRLPSNRRRGEIVERRRRARRRSW